MFDLHVWRMRIVCLFKGHRMVYSRSRPGFRKCQRCHHYVPE